MRVVIYRSIGRSGSFICADQVAVLYEDELPLDIDEIVDELGGDYYEIEET